MPSFSHTPTLQHSDIPNPWARAIAYEIQYHTEDIVKKNMVFYDNDPDVDEMKDFTLKEMYDMILLPLKIKAYRMRANGKIVEG
jgi:hypothetical protein